MNEQKATLLEALKGYELKVLGATDTTIMVSPAYEIEMEANGIFKLSEEGYIVGPFSDLNELCRFIRNGMLV